MAKFMITQEIFLIRDILLIDLSLGEVKFPGSVYTFI